MGSSVSITHRFKKAEPHMEGVSAGPEASDLPSGATPPGELGVHGPETAEGCGPCVVGGRTAANGGARISHGRRVFGEMGISR